MRNFIISTESTCDLPQKYVEQNDVKTINMFYTVDGKEYGDSDQALSTEEFYNAMKQGKQTFTSMVNEERATAFFTQLLQSGKDVVHVSFSSACSGTYESVKTAAEKLNATHQNKIYVVDSKCASCGQGLLVMYTVEYAENHTAEETYEYTLTKRDTINQIFTVDDLKYLARGGRVSKTSSVIGNALRIKPILYVDFIGKLTPVSKVLTRKTSLTTIANMVAGKVDDLTDRIIICHAVCEDEARSLAKRLQDHTGIPCEIGEIGFVIGCHSGPGTVAVFFSSASRELK